MLESLPEAEAAAAFTDLLLHYLIRTLLPYEGTPLEHGFEELSEATWYTIGECISLISMILAESDDSIKNVIIQCAAAVPGSCASMRLAFYIGTLIRKEGRSFCTRNFRVAIVLFTSNVHHIFTVYRITGKCSHKKIFV